VPSPVAGATPLLTHGWPGSVVEFVDLIFFRRFRTGG
jgi:hypothetical protein